MAWETAVVLGIVSVPFLMILIMTVLDKQHMPIKLLLLLMSFLLIGAILTIMINIAEGNDTEVMNIINGVYIGWIPVFMLFVFWFVISFIIEIVASIKVKRKRKYG